MKNDLAKTSPLRIGAYPALGCHGKSTYRTVKTQRERRKERSQQVTNCEGRGDDGRATERERERRGATAQGEGGEGGPGEGEGAARPPPPGASPPPRQRPPQKPAAMSRAMSRG